MRRRIDSYAATHAETKMAPTTAMPARRSALGARGAQRESDRCGKRPVRVSRRRGACQGSVVGVAKRNLEVCEVAKDRRAGAGVPVV